MASKRLFPDSCDDETLGEEILLSEPTVWSPDAKYLRRETRPETFFFLLGDIAFMLCWIAIITFAALAIRYEGRELEAMPAIMGYIGQTGILVSRTGCIYSPL